MKIADPDLPLPPITDRTDVRVLLPADPRFTVLADKLAAEGAEVRRVPHLVEDEAIRRLPDDPSERSLQSVTYPCALLRGPTRRPSRASGAAAVAARDAFALTWQAYDGAPSPDAGSVATNGLLPPTLSPFFPYPTFNPAQAQVLPAILDGDENLLVVAPTGAGKTVMGMAAALKSVLLRRRKAVWLVPQRSLTDELNHDLEAWKAKGVRVERLSGEYAVDADRMREADLWLATTEKFEAVSRSSALREALAEVDCLIVDEIHLLGDPARGPTLEAMLARMRDAQPPIRVVGLSATVGNAEEIAVWLRARLLHLTWRSSRLTWQLPAVAAHADWNVTEASRSRLATVISRLVTADGGSVLVFCGSKRNVRRTALLLAASRGVDTTRVRPDDAAQVHMVCGQAGVGLHYKDWPYRRDAEAAFRARQFDVLVATPTVAAGVNLPARAVVVRDTQVGLDGLDVATVQQMFGRAGRVGAGEDQGWAFLIVDDSERPAWQARLTEGYVVRSQIQSSLPDHVLGEVVREEVTSRTAADRWWVGTLAHQQGRRSLGPLRQAIQFLAGAGMVADTPADAGSDLEETLLAPTDLGQLTARLMVPATVCDHLRRTLNDLPVPASAAEAERALIRTVATLVPKLAQVAVPEEARNAVAGIINSGVVPTGPPAEPAAAATNLPEPQRGDLAQAALLAVANAPELFGESVTTIAGMPYAAIYPILEDAPRYLHWLASQGLLGTVHPWVAVVAGDLGRRVRWRRCRPPRGAGRLLWICELMATPVHLADAVPELWHAAVGNGHTAPDWPPGRPPRACRLPESAYRQLLYERATGCAIAVSGRDVVATGPSGAVVTVWAGRTHRAEPIRRGTAGTTFPPGDGDLGVVVFTWRGDHRATGWLGEYREIGVGSVE
ncbi:helicase [Micromonospora sp. M71_S20]|uniref:DEAD/DEAH box helicase n=1 Tax=Micromonospora sp. M71_S20 TaxID=592872 RepID=UPI000EACF53E|nr:DEAD/DEAH box helicase [Micromonospora sp. M71_S20]RLK24837.1 helicase [Micromonospora sp. M71_S20]